MQECAPLGNRNRVGVGRAGNRDQLCRHVAVLIDHENSKIPGRCGLTGQARCQGEVLDLVLWIGHLEGEDDAVRYLQGDFRGADSCRQIDLGVRLAPVAGSQVRAAIPDAHTQ